MQKKARTAAVHAAEPSREAFPLYDLSDVEAALGVRIGHAHGSGFAGDPTEAEGDDHCGWDTEHQKRLGTILAQGEARCWRHAVGPHAGSLAALEALASRAPHFADASAVIGRHLRAAINMGTPTRLPHILLLGAPGIGKTWYLSRLSELLGLPFCSYSMAAATLGEGLQGSHPTWRNAQPGLVARTLLHGSVGNPLIFVDELDKAHSHSSNADPWRPFYALLERSGSAAFVDEYLQFKLDASRVNWALASNDVDALPAPLLDRLTVIEVPAMSAEHFASVAASVYAEANGAKRGYFSPQPDQAVIERLAGLSARGIRIVVEEAMVAAAAENRRVLTPDDVRPRRSDGRRRIGFHR